MSDLQRMVSALAEELKSLYDGVSEDVAEMRRENGEDADLWDFVMNVLDLEYILDSNFELIGTILYTTLGGPNIYVDTRRGEVVGHWGTEEATCWMPSEVCNEIDDIVKETIAGNYNCPF